MHLHNIYVYKFMNIYVNIHLYYATLLEVINNSQCDIICNHWMDKFLDMFLRE